MTATVAAITFVGVFSVILGILHFTFPKYFGFMHAIPEAGDPVPPFRLLFYRYEMKRTDLRGIIYVMNHCVSYVILAIGVFDLYAYAWIGSQSGAITSVVAAGFWVLRALTQFYLGRRPGDWFVITWFLIIAVIQIFPAVM